MCGFYRSRIYRCLELNGTLIKEVLSRQNPISVMANIEKVFPFVSACVYQVALPIYKVGISFQIARDISTPNSLLSSLSYFSKPKFCAFDFTVPTLTE